MALLRRREKKTSAPARRKEKPKPKAAKQAALAPVEAEIAHDVFEEIRSLFWEPTDVLAAVLGAKFQLTTEEARRRIVSVRRTLRRHALEALKTSKEDLFLRQLEDSGRARKEKRWDDARAADRFIMDLTGAAAPKRGLVGFANLGVGGLDPQVAGLLGVMNVDEVEAIIAEGEEVDDG